MTINTAIRVYQGALSATPTTSLTTVNAATGAAVPLLVKDIVIANSDTVPRKVTLYGGVSASIAAMLLPAILVPANTAIMIGLNTILNAGESIFGGSDVAAVVGVTITGVKFV